jgi:transcription initiation factor TFIID TATA-box-binding protein
VFEIVNVVLTAEIDDTIDLEKLGKSRRFEFNPEKYRCAYFSDEGIEGKASIFSSGKIILVGAKSEATGRRSLNYLIGVLREEGYTEAENVYVITRNVVVTLEMDSCLDLESLAQSSQHTVYEPEQFPGAMLRLHNLGVTALIFQSGKIVLPGLESERVIARVVRAVREYLRPYRLDCR